MFSNARKHSWALRPGVNCNSYPLRDFALGQLALSPEIPRYSFGAHTVQKLLSQGNVHTDTFWKQQYHGCGWWVE